MPTLHPTPLPGAVLDDPHCDAERLLYSAFARRLGDAFTVLHSVAWLSRTLDAGARDGEADFIVAHRTGGIFGVEVKGGAISHDGATGRWHCRDRHDRVHEIDDSVKQARDNKYALRDKLRSLPGWRGEPPFLGQAVAFPNCTAPAQDLGLDLPRDIVIFSEDKAESTDRPVVWLRGERRISNDKHRGQRDHHAAGGPRRTPG